MLEHVNAHSKIIVIFFDIFRYLLGKVINRMLIISLLVELRRVALSIQHFN